MILAVHERAYRLLAGSRKENFAKSVIFFTFYQRYLVQLIPN